jgi:hypothetical protein
MQDDFPAKLQALAPGHLIDWEEITPAQDPEFPPGAQAWRVRYVSTGRDNLHRTVVSGVVIAPTDITTLDIVNGRGRMLAWTHGTLGVVQRCQPSGHPEQEIWGPTPFGINRIAWGNDERGDRHVGRAEDGILAGMIGHGWVVTATDYASEFSGGHTLQPFAIGKIEAANAIDNLRAAHHLLATVHGTPSVTAWVVVVWGHSQGGHAAVWTGQLLNEYDQATREPGATGLALRGVCAEAPASNLLTNGAVQGEAALGFSLFDWMVHAKLQLTGQPQPIPLAPFFMSYLTGAWTALAQSGIPHPNHMPAYPVEGTLDLAAVVTAAGQETVAQMTQACWADGDLVAELASPYTSTPFLVPELSDGPVVNGYQQGNFDCHLASDDLTEPLATWRAWIQYTNPGPLGVHPFSNVPAQDGVPVPLLITAGSNDGVVHCVATDPTQMPTATEGAPVALFEAMRTAYLEEGEPAAFLSLVIWRPEEGVTVADHSDVTGLIAAASRDDLRFHGSPLERFILGAFAGTLPREISATFGNP